MDFSLFEKLNQRRFTKMTRVGHKQRRLVIYPGFKNFVSRILDGNTLQNSFEKIHFFDDDFVFSSDTCYAFIIPPEIPVVRHVMWCKQNTQSKPFIELWFQPRINDILKAFLIDMKWAPDSIISSFPSVENSAKLNGAVAMENIEVHNLEIDVLPLDNDVLTLNSHYAFMRSNTIGDLTVVSEFRKALDVIHNYIGFATITGIGNLATSIAKSIQGPKNSSNNHLIIIDRATDLITPLITQMNYEGLIADLIGIDCGVVELEIDGKKQLEILSSTIGRLLTKSSGILPDS